MTQRAIHIVGGLQRLSERVDATPYEGRLWESGEALPPSYALLKMLDIVHEAMMREIAER